MDEYSWLLLIPDLIGNGIYLIEAAVTIFVLLFAVRYMKRNLQQNDEILGKMERIVTTYEQRFKQAGSEREKEQI